MSLEIFVARHGQSEDNIAGVIGGHRDAPLTDLGRQQAGQLAQGVIDAGLSFDAVYCSPLLRAKETAEIVCRIAGQPEPKVVAQLIERDIGILEGLPYAEAIAKCDPAEVLETDVVTYALSAEGAETFPDLIMRANEVLTDVRAWHKDGRVLLVCHGDFGKMLYAAATGKDWKEVLLDFHFGNAEMIDLSGNGEAHVIKLEQFNH